MTEPVIYTVTAADRRPDGSEHMPVGAVKVLAGKVSRRLTRYYRKWCQNRNHIFVHKGPFEFESAIECANLRYDHFKDVPDDIRDAIKHHGGQKTIDFDQQEMEEAAVMWIAILDQRLAGVLFTRRGRDFRRWFVELQDDDIVIFRMRTYPEFRGRGIAPALMSYAISSSLTHGNYAYIDCRVYNTSSIRAIQKAGFERFATMKPISRAEALSGGGEKKKGLF